MSAKSSGTTLPILASNPSLIVLIKAVELVLLHVAPATFFQLDVLSRFDLSTEF